MWSQERMLPGFYCQTLGGIGASGSQRNVLAVAPVYNAPTMCQPMCPLMCPQMCPLMCPPERPLMHPLMRPLMRPPMPALMRPLCVIFVVTSEGVGGNLHSVARNRPWPDKCIRHFRRNEHIVLLLASLGW